MFTKVLVSDDLGIINIGVLSTITALGITHVEEVQYCDDAYIKIKRGQKDNVPFDLLITDLSFKPDYREQKFSSGESLIKALKEECPALKIIVYTVEERIQKAKTLVYKLQVDGYVCKGRKGADELKEAIQSVFENKTYISPQMTQALNHKTTLEMDDYDVALIKLLSSGLSQEEISLHFKNTNISPSSLSSVEKRLNKLRIQFKAQNAIHLVTIVKDLGLI